MPARLATRDLAKHYGGVHALRGVSLDVAAGEVLGLVGLTELRRELGEGARG